MSCFHSFAASPSFPHDVLFSAVFCHLYCCYFLSLTSALIPGDHRRWFLHVSVSQSGRVVAPSRDWVLIALFSFLQSVMEIRVLNLPSPAMNLCIRPRSSIPLCFMCFEAPLLGTYVIRAIVSSWCIDLFVLRHSPSLFVVIFLVRRSALSDHNIDPAASFRLVFAWHAFNVLLLLIYVFISGVL